MNINAYITVMKKSECEIIVKDCYAKDLLSTMLSVKIAKILVY